MLALSLGGLRERWPLFLGALLSVAVGVALLSSAMTVAASAVPPDLTGLSAREVFETRDAFDAVATIMIISAMLSGLLTVFIVATTFAFTVAERRRDIALLRLLGAGRGHVRLVLLAEAATLGVIGSAIGLLLARPAVSVQMRLLRAAEFVPAGFTVQYPSWPLWTAAGIGVCVAVLGVLAASRRASHVPPLKALRDATGRDRVMTRGRWALGLTMLLATAAQITAAAFVGLVIAIALGLGVAVTGSIALSQLAPVVLPTATRVLGGPLRPSTLGSLAGANGREGVQRSASTAAPVILLIALLVSVSSALAATTTAVTVEERDSTRADLVVSTTGRHVESVSRIPGVSAASPESAPDLVIDLPNRSGETERLYDGYAVIDPEKFTAVRSITPVTGSIQELTGDTIAVTERPTDGITYRLGDPATIRVDGERIRARVGAILPERLSTDQQVLVPQDLVPPRLLAQAATDVLVGVSAGADAADVRAAAEQIGDTTSTDTWIAARAAALQRTNDATLTVLLTLSGLYTVMAVLNAIVIAGTGRRREHAVARLSGLTRAQVVATTLLEAVVTTATGVVLGLTVVAGAVLGIALAARRSVGVAVVEIPWTVLLSTTMGSLVLAALASALVAAHTTRVSPVRLAAARE